MEEINCPSLKIKINEVRCSMTRVENIKFWGSKSNQMTLCPCEKQQEGRDMDKNPNDTRKHYKYIGDCPKCDKKNVRLYGYKGQDICGGCRTRLQKYGKKADEIMPKIEAQIGDLSKESDYVSIDLESSFMNKFRKEDLQLYELLLADAKRNRRSPEQQILWIVEQRLQKAQSL